MKATFAFAHVAVVMGGASNPYSAEPKTGITCAKFGHEGHAHLPRCEPSPLSAQAMMGQNNVNYGILTTKEYSGDWLIAVIHRSSPP